MNWLDLNNNGVNDWEGLGQVLFQPFGTWNNLSSSLGGSGNVFQDIGAGVGGTVSDVGEGLFKGLTSNTGGLAILALGFILISKKL